MCMKVQNISEDSHGIREVSDTILQWRSPPAPLKYKRIYKELRVGRWMRIPKIDGDLDLSSDSTVFARDTKYLIGAQSTSLNLGAPHLPSLVDQPLLSILNPF